MLEKLLLDYIMDPENPAKNYAIGLEYESIGQTASAFTFYLRTAERTTDKDLAYDCLIRLGNCYLAQGNRKYSVKSMYNAAIALLPERPEAYYYLSKFYEGDTHYFDSYTTAEIGLAISKDKTFDPIRLYYPGRYALIFQKAVAAWWRGRGTESRALFQHLVDEHWNVLDDMHREAVKNNIVNLGSSPPSYIYRMYDPKKYGKLRYKFTGADKIKKNYSQVYQDLFVLSMLDGKKNGSFVEVGGAGPFKGNNTALLEELYGWKGVSIEFDPQFAKEYRSQRPTTVLEQDALKIDYAELFKKYFVQGPIDYLQLDIEPAENTYKCLKRIPLDKYKFRVITYEHDYYADFDRIYRDKSREHLESYGYVLVANDISPDGVNTFEDWWVHPDLVSKEILEIMKEVSPGAKDATAYMFPETPVTPYKDFDWGLIENNTWFRGYVEKEVFLDDIYQKFHKVPENGIVVDIGASVGPFAYKINKQGPATIYCIEPHPELFKTLQKNVDATCINKAIGYNDGKEYQDGLFNENSIDTGINQLVDTISFKTFISDYNINHIDFLKLDCEGSEYSIFTDENIDWIKNNVDYIVGEWHLHTMEFMYRFMNFRDKYLSQFSNVEVYSADGVNIKHDLHTDWFLEHYRDVTIYIDNRKKKVVHTLIDNRPTKKIIADKWKYSVAPTLEFTTTIPEKGCVVDCVFCPQRTLVANYNGERILSLDNFKKAVDKLPTEIRVTFSGFVEPWLNSKCTDMVLYAYEKSHPISVFTTLVGMSVNDLESIIHIPYAGPPNGGFTVHLPDSERKAKHPITKKYMETVRYLRDNMHRIQNLQFMSMGPLHEDIAPLFEGIYVHQPEMWSRSGNLIGERMLKPELQNQHFLSVDHGDKPMTCGCDERLYHNIMLPNGDVSLCCMDYGLEEITGNLFEQDYNDVIPDPYTVFKLCQKCENGIDVNSRFIKGERKMYNV